MPRVSDRQRIAQDIRDKISSGEYAPGDKLPSLREMTVHYGVSAEPVRSALLILHAEGLIEGHQGKGTYVTPRPAPTRRDGEA
ncbi:winged helix-turn-helix domain-containing protein [Micromonospora sp. NPDC047707]|uniref:winged helix-turn-helix domain-containing protein n=1 Tax=unclassified Micromonospora TaxID=2617518 RepID=UPI0012B4E59E|nr:winged helix-turn-helix domain-containing protein [Micromonospora sp. WMMC415]QGN46038.1 GntR family transcriptional regulator [Micromonospora sp. WMMC415]